MGQVAGTLVLRSLLAAAVLALVMGAPRLGLAQAARWRAGPPPTTPPSAAAIDEARQRNTKALKLYQEEGAVDAALAEFERAYDLAPSTVILYNIGQAARTGRDYALALHAYERYLADGAAEIRADRRQEVLEQVRELRTFVAALDVRVNVKGAKIFVDDVAVGTSPLGEKLSVNAGRVRVRAAFGGTQDSKVVVVPGGDQVTVELELAESGAGPASGGGAPTPQGGGAPPPDDGASAFSPYLWIGWGGAALLGAGAAVTGGLALSESSDLHGKTYAGGQAPDDLVSQGNTVKSLGITTDVLIGTAAAGLVVTSILAIAGVGAEAGEPAKKSGLGWSLRPLTAAAREPGTGGPSDRWGLECWGTF